MHSLRTRCYESERYFSSGRSIRHSSEQGQAAFFENPRHLQGNPARNQIHTDTINLGARAANISPQRYQIGENVSLQKPVLIRCIPRGMDHADDANAADSYVTNNKLVPISALSQSSTHPMLPNTPLHQTPTTMLQMTTRTMLSILVMLLFALHRCSADDQKHPEKNIIFIITDDQGPTLGCYGDRFAMTPNLDALANDGVLFQRAFATTASCSASRSVILSGIHNHKNGQFGHAHDFHKFASFHNVVRLSLPRNLANVGYRTARCGKFHVAPETVYHFDRTIAANERSTVEMAENCRPFLAEKSSAPFFLYFATSDPHRSEQVDQASTSELKPNLFGNKPNRKSFPLVTEVFYDPARIQPPSFLPDTLESREELAQYYQSCARVDQGVGRLISILKENDLYDNTLIVFTSDHGMAFAGAKTNVYEPGLRVPLIVRNPYSKTRGKVSEALVSHVDITPTLLDFAGALDSSKNAPAKPIDPDEFWKSRDEAQQDNRQGPFAFRSYHGKSWLPVLDTPEQQHHEAIFASHTFHEIQMYYPMRAYRDDRYKIIWNIAHKLDYPFASDLWIASSWQSQLRKGPTAQYGVRTVDTYVHRPKFELFDLRDDPNESQNLALSPANTELLQSYQAKLREMQRTLEDPWITKWDYE